MKARFAALLGCAAFLAVAAAAPALAIVRGERRVITACQAKKTGSFRVVDGQNRCSHNKIRISWNRTGPKGDPGIMGPAVRAGHTGATGREGVPEEIGPKDKGADGASGPAGAQGKKGPEGDNDAAGSDGGKGAHGAIGPSGAQKGPRGDNGAPGADGEIGHARAPPAVLSAPRTGPGA